MAVLAACWPHAIYKLKRKRRTLRIRNIAENNVIKIQLKSSRKATRRKAWGNSFQIKINAAAVTTFMCPQRGRGVENWESGRKSGRSFPLLLQSQAAKMP